jgi:hypothetical protein
MFVMLLEDRYCEDARHHLYLSLLSDHSAGRECLNATLSGNLDKEGVNQCKLAIPFVRMARKISFVVYIALSLAVIKRTVVVDKMVLVALCD